MTPTTDPSQGSPPSPESPSSDGLSGIVAPPGFWARLFGTIDRANLPLLASALTFDALLAFIPVAVLVVGGLGLLLDRTQYFGAADPSAMILRLFPDAPVGQDGGTVALAERLLEGVRAYRSRLTLFAIPAFLWFSTRLFGSMRICLSAIFEVAGPRLPGGMVVSYLLGYAWGKLRDLLTVGVVFALALVSTVVSAGLSLLDGAPGTLPPEWAFLVSTLGLWLGKCVAILSALVLFALLYRYASPKRMAWRGALLAGGVATVAFELAKYLYGMYLGSVATSARYAVDAGVGAALLLVLWIWYTALVFLGGAAIAHAWDRGRHRRDPEAPPLLGGAGVGGVGE